MSWRRLLGSSVTNSATTDDGRAAGLIGISRAHRAEDQLVAHRGPLTKRYCRARWPASAKGCGKALDQTPRARRALRSRLNEIDTQDIAEPGHRPAAPGRAAAPGHRRAFLAGEGKGDVGRAIASRRNHFADRFGPRCGRLEEFSRARCRVKRSLTSPRVPCDSAAGMMSDFAPPSDDSDQRAARRMPRVMQASPPRRSRAAPRRGTRACGCAGDPRRRAWRWRGGRRRWQGRHGSCRLPSW